MQFSSKETTYIEPLKKLNHNQKTHKKGLEMNITHLKSTNTYHLVKESHQKFQTVISNCDKIV